jgi:nicotinamide-nucleotide amidase
MKAEIIVVGSELVRGHRTDKNGPFLCLELGRLGLDVCRMTLIPDRPACITADTAGAVSRRAEVLMICGGLGPTVDDVTREAVAAALGQQLVIDEELRREVSGRAASFGDVSDTAIDRQSLVFPGARWFANRVGVAPGLAVQHGPTTVYLLPGPPPEMQEMFRRAVQPELSGRAPTRWVRILRTVGRREVAVAAAVEPLLMVRPGMTVAYLPGPGVVDVVLSCDLASHDDAADGVREALGDCVYGEDAQTLEEVVEELLVQRSQHLVTAESCTGGMVAGLLTSVPGSSRVFLGGVVAYSNSLKERLLGVPGSLLERCGAVSAEVAQAMARGALERLGGQWALSITGIAGPDGGSVDKPVGLVFHGLAGLDGRCEVARHLLGGDRAAIRLASARFALDLLRRCAAVA